MINIEFGPSTILGIFLVFGSIILYFLRSIKPKIARDSDIFFSSLALLSGGILIFQGWRLDPILLFGQMLSSGTAIFFLLESIQLREQKNLSSSEEMLNIIKKQQNLNNDMSKSKNKNFPNVPISNYKSLLDYTVPLDYKESFIKEKKRNN